MNVNDDPIELAKNYTKKIKNLYLQLGECKEIDDYIYEKSITEIPKHNFKTNKDVINYIEIYFNDIINKINFEIDKKYCIALDTTNESYYL